MTPFIAVALTIAIELPLAYGLIRRGRPARFFVDVIFINLFTNPAANWAVAEGANFLVIETAVVLLEWLAYALVSRFTWGQAALLSLILNAVSASIGILVF